jgi:TonB family protein
VSADGQVTQCTVTESSGSPTLDETACRLMRARASFHPARDATGKAIAARWSSKYRWDLPEIPPIPSTSWHIAAVLKVSATGTVLSCATQSTGPIPSSIAKPCDTFKGSVPPQLFRAIGGAGRPQSLTVEAALTFDDAPSPKLHYLGPGQQLSALVKVAFDVSEVGAVENCRSLPTNQERWLGAQANLCGTLNDSFVAPVGADGKPRRANAVLMTAWSKMR